MNFRENESPEKLRGGYYTPPEIAAFLARWVLGGRPQRILEPSLGDGAFVRAIAAVGCDELQCLTGCELSAEEAGKAEACMRSLLPDVSHELLVGDFLAWVLDELEGGQRFDGILGNPPFIRYQYLDAVLQERAESIIRRFGLRFTKHTNAWVPFLIASLALLCPGGRFGMVIPAELLHVLHAQSARSFLLEQCSRVLILDPEELWFEGTLQGVVLVLAEKKSDGDDVARKADVSIAQVQGRHCWAQDPEELFDKASYTVGASLPGKWMLALLPQHLRERLVQLAQHPDVYLFDALAKVSVGIVTGANKFFLVPDEVVDTYGLQSFVQPMFGRSDHVPGVIYDEASHQANREAGYPTNFLWFRDETMDSLDAGPRRYIEKGEAEGLHTRYKCRVREPWFTVPSVFSTPIGMLKRSHDFPRLVLNELGAYTTDTAYRITPEEGIDAERLVASFVNSVTALMAEIEGRHYGGGVLELVPSEIRRLLFPMPRTSEASLASLEQAFRDGLSSSAIIAQRDPLILGALGLENDVQDELRHAWWMLRNRRQRRKSQLVG